MAMEQFDKWWDKNKYDFQSRINHASRWKAASEVWKAALEWAEDVASKNKDKKTLVEIIKELESGY